MKLSHYAEQQGISYRTALRWWRAGTVNGCQALIGTMIVTAGGPQPTKRPETVAVYARVSSAEHKANLEQQAARLSGQRRAKRKTERIAAELRGDVEEGHADATG